MKRSINRLFRWYLHQRFRRIERFKRQPHTVQRELLMQMISASKNTVWGRRFHYKSMRSPRDFARRVPVQDYESLKPFINRMMYGEKDVLWNGYVRWFSKSSGTTNDKSKFIPVTPINLKSCHIRGSWDTMTLLYERYPHARQFESKSLVMGGSLNTFAPYPRTRFGDVSAIMTYNMPYVGRPFFTPDIETALMPEWEEKINRIADIISQEKNLVSVGGVPTWTIVLFRKVLEITGKDHILEVWPEFQSYIHGGVSFTPYRKQFREFLPSDDIIYQETYNASEGYFAVQDRFESGDMLLLLDNGIYYEFLPMEEWDKEEPEAVPLSEVEPGRNYAMIITTNAGMWRYLIGDTVEFTSTSPYRIRITGRTQQFVNAFGEEVMVANTDKALAETCRQTGAAVVDYTVAPIYFSEAGKGSHEWIIEFEKHPEDLEAFRTLLDKNLQRINSDYEAKRYKSMALEKLTIRPVPENSFHKWLKSKGKLGGQHKVPRLANNRKYVEDILQFVEENV
jgi:hypothetical protein